MYLLIGQIKWRYRCAIVDNLLIDSIKRLNQYINNGSKLTDLIKRVYPYMLIVSIKRLYQYINVDILVID